MKTKLMILVGLLALTACDSYLEENPSDRVPADEAYQTRNELYLNAVAAIYRDVGGSENCQGLQGTGHGVYDLNTFTTDEAIMPTRGADWYDGGYWQALFLHKFEQADGTGDVWNYLMKEIQGCNGSLARIDKFAKANPNVDVSDLEAEVRALRAMFYFYAMDLYGRVPVFSSTSPSVADLQVKSRSETYRHIVSELQEVAPQLTEERSNLPGTYYGRMTQGAAYFLLAKLMLNAEVYADDDWTDATHPDGKNIKWNVNGQQMNSWEATICYCDRLQALGYQLEGSFQRNFAVNNEQSLENIYTIPMNKYLYDTQFINLFRSRHYNHAAAMGLNGENGSSATIEAITAFGLKRDLNDMSQLDPRFYMTYYAGTALDLNGNIVLLDDGTPLVYEPWHVALDVSGTAWEKTSGARMAKYEVDPTGTKDGKQSDNDIVLFRYSDVLLMQAEALVRNGQDGSEPFNAVRNRVGAEPRECTLDNILTERLLELAWEGWRRNDLIRFDRFTRSYTDRPQLPGESNHYTIVFPIPGEFLTLTSTSQNPGY